MIALVTGVGRKKAIGAAICRELAKSGVTGIFFTYWHQYDLVDYSNEQLVVPDELARELEGLGAKAASMEIDLRRPDAAQELFKSVEEKLGSPDILINNATIGIRMSLSELTAAGLDDHYAVNVRSTALLCKEFVARAGKAGGGKIVNVTSGQSVSVMEGELPYTVTKACADMLVIQLAPELRRQDITINAFDPGPTDSGWITGDIRADIEKRMRIRTPEEVATALVSLLASDQTGQVIHYGR